MNVDFTGAYIHLRIQGRHYNLIREYANRYEITVLAAVLLASK